MVGLVIVSHSARLAEGVAELVRGVGGDDIALATAGGLDLPGQPLGTDPMLVLAAIESVYSPDGVLVLMDLGSAVLSAEMALDMLPPEHRPNVVLCEAPLVEGAVAAAVQARLGSPLSQVLADARGGLGPKAAHLGVELASPASPAPSGAPAPTFAPSTARAERRVRVGQPSGLHARPAAEFVKAAGRFPGATVTLANLTSGRGPVDAKSLLSVLTLGVNQGDEILLVAQGPNVVDVLDALVRLVDTPKAS
jgi:multiphosphoryl transfer protein